MRQGYYKEGTLRFTIETDETSAYSRSVFTDFDGRKVAELEDDAWTFWVYDECGRLRFTVSPEGARRLTAEACATQLRWSNTARNGDTTDATG